jgi:hypothetical protein
MSVLHRKEVNTMKIFKIHKTYMVTAGDRATAEIMVRARDVGELFLVEAATDELPELEDSRMNGWFAELKRQVAG